MKLFKSILLVTVLFLGSSSLKAQNLNADFFAGKWSVLLKALPQGDTKLIFVLEKKDAGLAGVVQDTTGKEITKIDKVEVAEGQVSIYFSAQGYDVTLVLNKKDEDHVTGSLMNMFEAEGERVKEEKK